MCRNIRTLFNFDPPATDEEIRASSEQFVRKLSGFAKPSKANEAAYERAVEDVFKVARPDRFAGNVEPAARPRSRSAEGAGTGGGTVCLEREITAPLIPAQARTQAENVAHAGFPLARE